MEFQGVVMRFVKQMSDLPFKQGGFLLDVQAAEKIVDLGLEAAVCCDADFCCWGRLETSDIGDVAGDSLVEIPADSSVHS